MHDSNVGIIEAPDTSHTTADAGSPPNLVYVVDNHKVLRESLLFLLGSTGLDVLTYPSGLEFLSEVKEGAAGCALIDLRMEGLSGLEVLQNLMQIDTDIVPIILSAHAEVSITVNAMQMGAYNVLEKGLSETKLLQTVTKALRESTLRRQTRFERLEIESEIESLTPRERQVMDLVIMGRKSKEIADELNITHKTTDTHRANMMRKMNVNGLAELISKVMRFRQMSPSSDI